MGWIGCAIQQVTSKGLPGFFFSFNILIFIYFFKYKTIETHARAFLPLNISAIGTVPFEGLYVDKFQRWTPFLGLYDFERGSASRNNLILSMTVSSIGQSLPSSCLKSLTQFAQWEQQLHSNNLWDVSCSFHKAQGFYLLDSEFAII